VVSPLIASLEVCGFGLAEMVLLRSLVHEIGNESVPKIIVNDTIKFFSQTAISTLVGSNHNSFRVLFDKLLLCILFEKYINVLALQ